MRYVYVSPWGGLGREAQCRIWLLIRKGLFSRTLDISLSSLAHLHPCCLALHTPCFLLLVKISLCCEVGSNGGTPLREHHATPGTPYVHRLVAVHVLTVHDLAVCRRASCACQQRAFSKQNFKLHGYPECALHAPMTYSH